MIIFNMLIWRTCTWLDLVFCKLVFYGVLWITWLPLASYYVVFESDLFKYSSIMLMISYTVILGQARYVLSLYNLR